MSAEHPLVVAVTGHRPDKLGGYKVPNPLYTIVVTGLIEALEQLKPDYVITGMAIGVDQWMAEICLAKQIPYVAAIPFEHQERKWPPAAQAKYHWLISKAFQKYVICDGDYAPWKMQKRNEWMINSAEQVIAVWNGTEGGTANCIGYAVKMQKPIWYVPLPPPEVPVDQFFQSILKKGLGFTDNEEKQQEPPQGGPPKRIIDL